MQKAIARQAEHIRLLNVVIPVLEAERTKSPTKHLATKIEKALNDSTMHVVWNPDKYGSKEISIYGGILKYEDALTISFSKNWGTGWRLATEQAVVDDVIELTKKWRENGEFGLKQLRAELTKFSEMAKEYKQIHLAYKEACQIFKKRHGTLESFGEKNISYTARRALEEVTGVKIEL